MGSNGDKGVDYQITAENSQYVAAMERCASATADATQKIRGQFENIGKAFEVVQKQLLVLTAIVGGGAFFKDAIAASNKLTGETMQLSKRLGLTAEQASALNTALGDIGSDSETYIGAFDKFAKQLKSNEAGLRDMGLQTRDANGNLRDSNELFTEALQTVGHYKPGLDQTTASMTLFGKGVDDVMKLQKLNNGVIEEAKRKNAELGLTITKENVEASKKYKAAMNDVGDILTAVQKAIGDAVMPVFTEMAEYFAETGPYVINVFKGALTGLLLVFRTLQAGVKFMANAIFEVISTVMDQVANLGELVSALLQGDFDRAKRAADAFGGRWKETWRNMGRSAVEAYEDATGKFGGDLNRMWGDGTELDKPKGGSKTMGVFKEKPDKKDPGRTAMWEAELEEQKLAIAEKARLDGTFQQMTLAQESAFWAERLRLQDLTENERNALRKKAAHIGLEIDKEAFSARIESLKVEREAMEKDYGARIQLAETAYREIVSKYGAESKEAKAAYGEILSERRKLEEQQRQLAMSAADAQRSRQQLEIELERQAVQEQLSLGLITRERTLQAEAQFEDRLYQIKLEALRQRLALISKDKDPVAWDQANRQIEQAEQQHELRMSQIRTQSAVETNRGITSTLGSISSSWAGLIQQLASGALSIGGFVKGMFMSVAQACINTVAQIAANWLVQQLAMKVLGKTTAAGQVQANAGVAGSAAIASTAAIPLIGPELAPAAGAAAFAGAMSFLPAVLASARGGFDIPASVNPITQLHEREMVLPAQHADTIRRLGELGGLDGGGQGGMVELKGMSMGEFFAVNRGEFLKFLRGLNRDFALR